MSIKDNRLLKVVAAGAAAMMILGLAAAVTSAQRGSGDPARLQGPGGPGGPGGPMGGRGRGMLGGPGMRGGRGGPGGPLGVFGGGMRALELTDAQREQVRTVMESHQADLDALGARMAEARKALHDAITADVPNEALIREAAAGVAAVEADGAVLRSRIHAEVFSLLTAEQQQKAKELKAEHEKRMKERTDRMRERRKQIQDTMRIGDPGLV
ncbi:MAG: Spy/CpxP family protein refolding chaperone [Acidobacteriota bacterium]